VARTIQGEGPKDESGRDRGQCWELIKKGGGRGEREGGKGGGTSRTKGRERINKKMSDIMK